MALGDIIRLFIASPGDVSKERDEACRAVLLWNAANSFSRNTIVEAVRNETHAMSELGGPCQDLINKQLLDRCDFLVAIFHARLGTKTKTDPSGTAQEIREFSKLKGLNQVMVFFNDDNIPSNTAADELARFRDFRESIQQMGIAVSYPSNEKFAEVFGHQLNLRMNKLIESSVTIANPVAKQVGKQRLSKYAHAILLASCCSNGEIVCLKTRGEVDFEFGSIEFSLDHETANRWESGIRELVQQHAAFSAGQSTYRLESSGYNLGKELWSVILLSYFKDEHGFDDLIECEDLVGKKFYGVELTADYLKELLSELASLGYLREESGTLDGDFDLYQLLPKSNDKIRLAANFDIARFRAD